MKQDRLFGFNTGEAYQRYLERAKQEKSSPQIPTQPTSLEGVDKGDYIFMPQHRLYVAKERSHLNKDWYKAHEALHKERARMLTLREFVDFLNLLGNGNEEFKRIYKEITEIRTPWRAEWIDADFKVVNDRLHINYAHRTVNGELKPQNSELLTSYLTTDKTPGISLDDWLSSPTSQGLPKSDVKDGSLYYWAPMSDNNSVAWFGAYSGRAYLGCFRYPQGSDPALGVRAARNEV